MENNEIPAATIAKIFGAGLAVGWLYTRSRYRKRFVNSRIVDSLLLRDELVNYMIESYMDPTLDHEEFVRTAQNKIDFINMIDNV